MDTQTIQCGDAVFAAGETRRVRHIARHPAGAVAILSGRVNVALDRLITIRNGFHVALIAA